MLFSFFSAKIRTIVLSKEEETKTKSIKQELLENTSLMLMKMVRVRGARTLS